MKSLDAQAFAETAELVAAWRRPLLVSHARPDGDALGSLAAAHALLTQNGSQPIALLFEPLPDTYALFKSYEAFSILGNDLQHADLATVDGIILLDTCAEKQLEPIASFLRAAPQPKLAIDHHATRDDLVDHYLVDESAAATCVILYEWALAQAWTLTPRTCEALFTGIATDTGWFRFSNTDGRALHAAADLVGRGVSSHAIHQQLYLRDSPARLKLTCRALASLELLADQRVAVIVLRDADYQAAGADAADTENIVNEPLRIATVAVSMILVDRGDGQVRVSFRSKPPLGDQTLDVNVAAIAQSFGGGGHRRAAAARINGTVDEIRDRVVQAVVDEASA